MFGKEVILLEEDESFSLIIAGFDLPEDLVTSGVRKLIFIDEIRGRTRRSNLLGTNNCFFTTNVLNYAKEVCPHHCIHTFWLR